MVKREKSQLSCLLAVSAFHFGNSAHINYTETHTAGGEAKSLPISREEVFIDEIFCCE